MIYIAAGIVAIIMLCLLFIVFKNKTELNQYKQDLKKERNKTNETINKIYEEAQKTSTGDISADFDELGNIMCDLQKDR